MEQAVAADPVAEELYRGVMRLELTFDAEGGTYAECGSCRTRGWMSVVDPVALSVAACSLVWPTSPGAMACSPDPGSMPTDLPGRVWRACGAAELDAYRRASGLDHDVPAEHAGVWPGTDGRLSGRDRHRGTGRGPARSRSGATAGSALSTEAIASSQRRWPPTGDLGQPGPAAGRPTPSPGPVHRRN